MDGLRTGISVLAGFDQHINDLSTEMNLSRAYRLLGVIPSTVANSYRVLNGQEFIESDSQLSYSGNFYYMITGRMPSMLEKEFFDQSFVLYSEHELSNSTFAARVII